MINKQGLLMDLEKIEAMTSWPKPKSVKELKGFLGLIEYYRIFMARYGILARPLTRLFKKNAI